LGRPSTATSSIDAVAGQARGEAADDWDAFDQCLLLLLLLLLLQAKPGVKLMMIGETIDGHKLY
jgi:hypothetical protein